MKVEKSREKSGIFSIHGNESFGGHGKLCIHCMQMLEKQGIDIHSYRRLVSRIICNTNWLGKNVIYSFFKNKVYENLEAQNC